MRQHFSQHFSTYSIIAHDPATGDLGVAVQTHQMCVGAVVPWLRPGLGAVATQASCNISFGPLALAMLAEGVDPEHVVAALVASDAGADRRQVAVIDAQGRAAAWTGPRCIAEASHHTGGGYSVQANMMTRPTVIPAMAQAYERAEGDLAARMLAALQAAQAEDGDIRGMQSAALKVVPGDRAKPAWETLYDLRVDEHAAPLDELARLVRLRRAALTDERGFHAFQAGQREEAQVLWREARATAPEMEELPFWQALTLADGTGDVEPAAALLREVFLDDPRRAEWTDLIRRLEACGMLERAGIADEIIRTLGW